MIQVKQEKKISKNAEHFLITFYKEYTPLVHVILGDPKIVYLFYIVYARFL